MKNTIEKIVKVIKITLISFGALAIIGIIAAINSDDTQPEAEPVVAIKTEEPKPVEVKPAVIKPEPIKNNEQEDKEQIIFATLKESYKGVAKVTFDSEAKSFNIKPTEPAFVLELTQVINGENIESYDYLVSSFKEASGNLEDTLGSGYMINLLNPVNPTNSLIIAIDGEIIYKFK